MPSSLPPRFPQPFQAPHWLRGAHPQTIHAPLTRRFPSPLPRIRERLTLADGDFIDIDHVETGNTASALVIVLHGLAGSTDSVYIRGIQQSLLEKNIASVAMNFRGAAGTHNRLARSYHAGDTADLDALLRTMATRFPRRPLAILGYSLGGSVVLKWLGETREGASVRTHVVAACAVSVPFDLAVCAARLDQGFSRIYRNRLRDELVNNLINKERALRTQSRLVEAGQLHALGDLRRITTFREFDDHVIAPLHSFRSADDYYQRASARQFMRNINTPTCVIHALDDPFMTPEVVPSSDELSPCVELAISPHGGHVGFVCGTPWQPRYWLEEKIPAFFSTHFSAVTAAEK